MKRLCTICARGGSKGLPNKNIRPLLEKPLIVHTIERARESGIFDCIAVSSDSREIQAIAEANGVDYAIERPPALATDTASKLPAILHAMLAVEAKRGLRYDTLVDLDATSPLRLAEDIRGAVDLLERDRVSSVITGATSHRSPYFNLVEEMADGSVRLAKPFEGAPYRRQDVPPRSIWMLRSTCGMPLSFARIRRSSIRTRDCSKCRWSDHATSTAISISRSSNS